MKLKKTRWWLITLLLLMCMMVIVTSYPKVEAYTPSVTAVKIGLIYGANALPNANLLNVDGFGSGYEFGYFDERREFVSTGAWTDIKAITMLKDRNMSYSPGGQFTEYVDGVNGTVVVGCYHIQLSGTYDNFYDAKLTADSYPGGFVKFDTGLFYAYVGNYTSEEEAKNMMLQMGINGTINSGTVNTVAVVESKTNNILFEFDNGTTNYLGVMPISDNGLKTETWFRGNKYLGGFEYIRNDTGNINVINVANIEDYVKGVLPHEMPSHWPIEALKAQACCARTYAIAYLNKHKTHGFDLCTTEECQVYGSREWANETTDRAVDETAGMYITYAGEPCETFFYSSNGGATENVENVWIETLPYLRGVMDPYEADVASIIPKYNWTLTYTQSELTERMRRRYNCATIVSMTITEISATGNVIRVTLKDTNGTSWNISKRDNLNYFLGVPSIRFTVGNNTHPGAVSSSIYVNNSTTILSGNSHYVLGGNGSIAEIPGNAMIAITGSGVTELVSGEVPVVSSGGGNGMVGDKFTIKGSGSGHNVGMSQWGAYSMAEYHNMSYRDILNFYFTGVVIG